MLLGLSYLSPISFLPWTNVFQDTCAVFALVALFLSKENRIKYINKNIFILYFLIVLYIFFQKILGLYVFNQDLFLSLFYISILFFSIIIGFNFINYNKKLFSFSVFFIFISLVSCIFQIFQWFGFESVFLMDNSGMRPFANFGQPNNLATFLMIGYISLIYIYSLKKEKFFLFLFISWVFLFCVALTQSRTSWVIILILLIVSFRKIDFNIFKVLILNSIVFTIFVITIPYFTYLIHSRGMNVIERIKSDHSRLDIWYQMLLAIKEKPLLGYGWNQTAIAQEAISSTYAVNLWIEYSHNIFLDLLVWNGLPVGILLIFTILYWIFVCYKRINTVEIFFPYLVVIIFLIHCLLEFPFAYAYFLIPIGIYVGIVSRNTLYFGNVLYLKRIWFLFPLMIFLSLIIFIFEYKAVEDKRNTLSYNYLFDHQGKLYHDNVFLLDYLSVNSDFMYLDFCDLTNKYSLRDAKEIYYRYPTNKNIINYYQFLIYDGSIDLKMLNRLKVKYPNFNEKSKSYYSKKVSDCR